MKKTTILLFLILFFMPSVCFGISALIGANGLTGGTSTDLDGRECDDILNNNTQRAIADGDMAVVVDHTGGTAGKLYFYVYDLTGSDSEDSPFIIVPDDQADCSNQGQWNLIQEFHVNRVAQPTVIFRDSDGTDSDDNAQIYTNLTDTGSGSEDADIVIQTQVGGSMTTKATIDADGSIDFADDVTSTATITGETHITLDTAATVDLSAATSTRGHWRINNDNDVIDYTLPPAEAGSHVCFYSRYAQVVTVDVDDGADTIVLDGTALDGGDAIDSAGGAGDHICLLAVDGTFWLTHNRSGTWVDGGVD